MLGAPGSGKGTVAKLLTKVLNIEHISTGDMFRENIKSGSEIGQELERYMSKGMLVPDDIVIELLEERLSTNSTKWRCTRWISKNKITSKIFKNNVRKKKSKGRYSYTIKHT